MSRGDWDPFTSWEEAMASDIPKDLRERCEAAQVEAGLFRRNGSPAVEAAHRTRRITGESARGFARDERMRHLYLVILCLLDMHPDTSMLPSVVS